MLSNAQNLFLKQVHESHLIKENLSCSRVANTLVQSFIKDLSLYYLFKRLKLIFTTPFAFIVVFSYMRLYAKRTKPLILF